MKGNKNGKSIETDPIGYGDLGMISANQDLVPPFKYGFEEEREHDKENI